MGKTAKFEFTIDQITLLIKATDHLIDAFSQSETRGYKAIVDKLNKIKEQLQQGLSSLKSE
ncbi:MAG: hypothetical protein QXP36_12150 [Conexivisphaerales archaeon]